jgi:hypothetical protein
MPAASGCTTCKLISSLWICRIISRRCLRFISFQWPRVEGFVAFWILSGGLAFAGYTHRVAISNHRLVAFDHDQVTFRYKDYAHGNKKRLMTLSAQEFLRRFLLHVLPRGFVRIRFYGFLAHRRRANLLPLCEQLLLHHPKPLSQIQPTAAPVTGFRCPHCATVMRIIETFSPFTFAPTRSTSLDSS